VRRLGAVPRMLAGLAPGFIRDLFTGNVDNASEPVRAIAPK
jgi:hypothetical protein